jgi:uncharacterized protein (TIRG00374 family)
MSAALVRTGRSARRSALVATGYAIGITAMAWAVWLARGSALAQEPTHVRWGYVAAAVAVDVAAYGCQAQRWQLLLHSVGRLSWFAAARMIYIGLFVSEMLPMRPGDGVRAWLAARELGATVAAVVPSIVVERFFDAVLLVASVGLTAMVAPLPPTLATAGRALGAIVLTATAAFALTIARGTGLDRQHGHSRVRSVLREVATGIRAIGVARTTVAAFALSCVLLIGQILAFWLAMRASGVDRSLLVAAIVLTLVHLGTAVPTTPGNAGTFQVFAILGLTLFGVDRPTAAAFSIVGFLILTVPLWLLGAVAFASGRLWRNTRVWRPCRSTDMCHSFATANPASCESAPGTEVAASGYRGVR